VRAFSSDCERSTIKRFTPKSNLYSDLDSQLCHRECSLMARLHWRPSRSRQKVAVNFFVAGDFLSPAWATKSHRRQKKVDGDCLSTSTSTPVWTVDESLEKDGQRVYVRQSISSEPSLQSYWWSQRNLCGMHAPDGD